MTTVPIPAMPEKLSPTSFGMAPEGRVRRNLVWLLVAFAYLSVFPYCPKINNPNENVRVYMTRALVEYHTLDISKVESEWGWVNDKAKSTTKNTTRTGTRLFSSKAPGASFLGVPVLAAQTWLWHRIGWQSPSKLATILALRLFAVMVPLLGFLWALSRYFRRLSQSRAVGDLLLVAVALGSMFYPYGIHFVGHSLAAASSFGAFMALAPGGRITAERHRAVLGGFLAGLGVLFEYQNLLVAILLTVYVVAQRPRLLLYFVLGALPGAALLAGFHTLCFGHPWDFPYGHLENLEYQTTGHGRGFYGLSLPAARPLLGVLFLPGFGLLTCSPFLAVAVVALIYMIARGPRAEGLLCAAIAVLLWIFLAGIPNWRGGWSVGPRYIVAVVPFLTVTLAYAWPRVARRRFAGLAWGITAGLIVAGVFFNSLTAVVYPQTPPQVRNPVFQVILRLLGDGYAPYSIGYALGLRGPASLLPVAVAILGAIAFALTPAIKRGAEFADGRRALTIALMLSIAFVAPFAFWPQQTSVAEKDALRLIKSTWTPPPAGNSG
jgi:hypothetical protein